MMRSYVPLSAVLVLFLGCSPSTTPASPGPAVSGSGAKPAPGPVRVAFVTNNASDFWKIAEAGTKKAAKELGCEVLFRIPSAGTAQEQQAILQDMVTVGVSGIAISPKDCTL